MMRRRGVVVFFLALLIVLVKFSQLTASNFYENKTIRIVVGFSAGGGFDVYARTIGRHLSKHIAGNPSIVIENMPGAGSLIAANQVYNQAKPDGLTVVTFIGSLVFQDVLGNKGVKFDGRKFGWLGAPTPESVVCAVSKASGVNNIDDWFAAKRPIKLGSTAPGSTTDGAPKLLKAALNLPIQVVSGYGGTAKVRLAVDSGEIDGGCWGWESIKSTWSKAFATGEMKVVLQAMSEPHPELASVPLARSYAKTDEQRDLLDVINDAFGLGVFVYAVPPDTPESHLRTLRNAFEETVRDPDFLAEARKAKLDIRPVSSLKLTEIFNRLYSIKPEKKQDLKQILLPQ